ncbi:MAG TPA: pyridoxal phosphate-dependent aminotransferase [Clostridiales bacterium]|nr:pyridoxal phosphate-dependent aminotransferase [Clostridiales bacterium]
MGEKRIYLSAPHMSGHEQDYIKEAFETNWIAPLGPNVDAFEQAMVEYSGAKAAAALSAGTAAIHLAFILLDVKPGDTVFCSSLTFSASANPICYQGATPVFIDCDEDTWTMSPAALERAFQDAEAKGKLPKAVIVVNLYGQSCDMEPIIAIADRYNVPVVEDAAESLGSTYKGKKCGTLGKLGIYSFNGNKIITTSGGGMLIGDDKELIEKARFYATQSREPARYYQHEKLGYNYRMSNIVAGIGRAQIKILNDRVARKREVFARYKKELAGLDGLTFMEDADYGVSNKWLTVIRIDPKMSPVKPLDIMETLEKENIESRPVWKPMHLQPVFARCNFYAKEDGQDISKMLFEQGVCMPSGTQMTAAEQDRVIEIVKGLWK